MLPHSFETCASTHPLSPVALEHSAKSATSLGWPMPPMSRVRPVCCVSVGKGRRGGEHPHKILKTRNMLKVSLLCLVLFETMTFSDIQPAN